MTNDKNLFSINALAEELQIDRRTISKRLADIKPASLARNAKLYRLRDSIPALATDLIQDLPRVDRTYQEAKRRRELALAKLSELELAEKEGRLADVNKLAEHWARTGSNIRNRLLSIPTTAAPQVVGVTITQAQAIIAGLIYDALMDLSGAPPGDIPDKKV